MKQNNLTSCDIRARANTMNRIQEAQENFLKAILDFFKNNPDEYFTATDLRKKLNLESGSKDWFIYGPLGVLKNRGELEQYKGKGFRINKAKCETR